MIKGSHAALLYPFTSFSSLLLMPNARVDNVFLCYATFLYRTEKLNTLRGPELFYNLSVDFILWPERFAIKYM